MTIHIVVVTTEIVTITSLVCWGYINKTFRLGNKVFFSVIFADGRIATSFKLGWFTETNCKFDSSIRGRTQTTWPFGGEGGSGKTPCQTTRGRGGLAENHVTFPPHFCIFIPYRTRELSFTARAKPRDYHTVIFRELTFGDSPWLLSLAVRSPHTPSP